MGHTTYCIFPLLQDWIPGAARLGVIFTKVLDNTRTHTTGRFYRGLQLSWGIQASIKTVIHYAFVLLCVVLRLLGMRRSFLHTGKPDSESLLRLRGGCTVTDAAPMWPRQRIKKTETSSSAAALFELKLYNFSVRQSHPSWRISGAKCQRGKTATPEWFSLAALTTRSARKCVFSLNRGRRKDNLRPQNLTKRLTLSGRSISKRQRITGNICDWLIYVFFAVAAVF